MRVKIPDNIPWLEIEPRFRSHRFIISDSTIRENGHLVPVAGDALFMQRIIEFRRQIFTMRRTAEYLKAATRHTIIVVVVLETIYTRIHVYVYGISAMQRAKHAPRACSYAKAEKPCSQLSASNVSLTRFLLRQGGFLVCIRSAPPEAESSYKFLWKCIHNDKLGILL